MNYPTTDLEGRVLNLVSQHSERIVFVRGTEIISVPDERYRSGLREFWDDYKEVPMLVLDDSKRKAAFTELLNIGKDAVPTLVKILISERGEYPEWFSTIDDGVLPVLMELADEETSMTLVRPFQQKVKKVAGLNAEKYDSAEPYEHQVWSIALLWEKYPVPEAIPALKMAIGERVKHKKTPQNYLFSEYVKDSFFHALSSIATEESVLSELNFAREDVEWHQYSWSNYWQALRSLEENKQKVGEVLYGIYRSTGDIKIREISSSVLGCSKAIYWVKRKFDLR